MTYRCLFRTLTEVSSCSFVWNLSLCLLIFLILCVCFYVLGSSATSPGLKGVAFCRSSVGLRRATSPLLPEPGAPEVSPVWTACALLLWWCCGCCGPLVDGAGPWSSCLWGAAITAAGILVDMWGPVQKTLCGGASSNWGHPLGVVGQEPLWRRASQGKCVGLDRSAANARAGWIVLARRWQMLEMASACSWRAGWKEIFFKWCPLVLQCLKKVPIDPCPFGIRPKLRQWISFTYSFSSYCLYTGTQSKRVSASALSEQSFSFLLPSSAPGQKPPLFKKPDIMGDHLSRAGPQAWGAWCGAQIPLSLGKTFHICDIPSCLCVSAPGVWVLTTLCLCSSYLFQCVFFLYILSCIRAILLVFRSFSERVILCAIVVLVCSWE